MFQPERKEDLGRMKSLLLDSKLSSGNKNKTKIIINDKKKLKNFKKSNLSQNKNLQNVEKLSFSNICNSKNRELNEQSIENMKNKLMESFGFVEPLQYSQNLQSSEISNSRNNCLINSNINRVNPVNLKKSSNKVLRPNSRLSNNDGITNSSRDLRDKIDYLLPKNYKKKRNLTKDFTNIHQLASLNPIVNNNNTNTKEERDYSNQRDFSFKSSTKNNSSKTFNNIRNIQEKEAKTKDLNLSTDKYERFKTQTTHSNFTNKKVETIKQNKLVSSLSDSTNKQLQQLDSLLKKLSVSSNEFVRVKVNQSINKYFPGLNSSKNESNSKHHKKSHSQDIKNLSRLNNTDCKVFKNNQDNKSNNLNELGLITSEFDKLKLNYEKLLNEYKTLKENLPNIKNLETNITNQIFVTDSNSTFSKVPVLDKKSSDQNTSNYNIKILNNTAKEKPKILKERSKSNKKKEYGVNSESKRKTKRQNSNNNKSLKSSEKVETFIVEEKGNDLQSRQLEGK